MRNRLLPWIAPAILCLIVANHFVLVNMSSLSPWKGGGFGMFSTVDSPGARFLRVYLLTADGNIPVMVPKHLRKQVQEIRTIPTPDRTIELANSIGQGVWVRLRMVSAVDHYRQLLGDSEDDSDDSPHLQETAVIDFKEQGFLRMLDENESLNNDDVQIDFHGVRIETWKYSFAMKKRILEAEKIAEIEIALHAGSTMQ